MQTIEDIVYAAFNLGKQDEIYDKVRELKTNDAYKGRTLVELYEISYKIVTRND
jgi:hypothetical protein